MEMDIPRIELAGIAPEIALTVALRERGRAARG